MKASHSFDRMSTQEELHQVLMEETTMSKTTFFPMGAILDAWSHAEWDDGVQIDQLEDLTTLAVLTQNSTYEITVLNGHTGEVLVRGGNFFSERTAVRLEGSTFGGSILKRRGIYVGLRIEFVPEPVEMVSKAAHEPTTGQKEILLSHKVVLTSLVQSIGVAVSSPADAST